MNDCSAAIEHKKQTTLWVEHHIKICTYDIDFAAHVSNISYLRWLEDMRLMLFDKYFPLKGFLDQGKTPVLSSTNIQYKRAVKLFDPLYGFMWISDMSKVSLTIEAEMYVGNVLTTKVTHQGVFVDLATGKPIRIPAVCSELYARTSAPAAPAAR